MNTPTPMPGTATCDNCRFVRTFKPRPDEQDRYGFGEVGYGCRYPGYEGYTKADSTCPSFAARTALTTAGGRNG